MAGKRSPEFIAIPMVVIAVVIGGLVYWAVTADTVLAWTVLVVVSIVVGLLLIVALARMTRRPSDEEQPFVPARSPADGIFRLLVIVGDGSSSPEVREQLRASAAGRPAKAFVVATALSSRLDRWTGDQAASDRAAQELEGALATLGELGIEAQGQVGSHDPYQAALDGLREFPADEIVLAMHTGDDANWLEEGVVEKLRSRTSVPVTPVVVEKRSEMSDQELQ